ncbi:MAG TPA: hypothetical protein VMD97_07270 [Candidatus Aquilonibacter sp.]|nr:hypothetical protein [Candidatus Aquilonibacter sp.]
MIDETAGAGEYNATPENESSGTGERVAFCQQCGKPLTAETVRRAGPAVYCEPCLVARLEGQPSASSSNPGSATGPNPAASGWNPVNATTPPAGGTAPPSAGTVPPTANPLPGNEPSPWLAALLGLIPGVGAMYNGQYAKGVAHLVIFAILDSLNHNVNEIFGLLVLGWIFYQAFDAYHTAKARRDGTPLPNPFGLNDIGDRMGFGRNWPGSASRPVTSATTAGWATASAGSTAPPPPPNWTASGSSGTGWSGYVPPSNFGANAAPPPPPQPQPSAYTGTPGSSNWAQVPYANTYAGGPSSAGEPWPNPAGAPVPPPLPSRRFPIGAAWLIAIGLVFLLANLNGSWHLGGSWAIAIVLGALGAYILFRRVEIVLAWSRMAGEQNLHDEEHGVASRILCQIRGPVMLLVLALLFALQAAGIRTLGQTWGILLIAFGAVLILERSVGRANWSPTYPAASLSSAAVPPPPASTRKDGL